MINNNTIIMAYDNRPNLSCRQFDQKETDSLYLSGKNYVCGTGSTLSSDNGYRICNVPFIKSGIQLSTTLVGCNTAGNNQATAVGASAQSGGIASIAIGCSANAYCGCSIAIGTLSKSCGLDSIAIGENSCTTAPNSIAVGCGNISLGLGSSIIGGVNNKICSGNTYTSIIGGNSIALIGSTYSGYVVVPNLAIMCTPAGNGNVLCWDNTTKKVGITNLATGTPSVSNGLSLYGNNFVLGGTLTGDTTITGTGSSSIYFNMCNNTNYNILGADFLANSNIDGNAYDGGYITAQYCCTTIRNSFNNAEIVNEINLDHSGSVNDINITASCGGININAPKSSISLTSSGNTYLNGLPIKSTETNILYINNIGKLSYGTIFQPSVGNGLSLCGNNFVLGGTLTGDTTITGDYILDIVGNIKTKSLTLFELSGVTESSIGVDADGKVIRVSSGNNNIYSFTAVTSSITLTTGSSYVILVNTGSAITITLPSTPVSGLAYKIKDISGIASLNNIIVYGNGYNFEDNNTSTLINTDYGAIELMFNGYNWYRLSFNN